MENKIAISVVLPCLNEEETIGICVEKAFALFEKLGVSGEVIVSDNGSTDGSIKIAQEKGARVAYAPEKGYGNAYLKGLSESKAEYIIMADADNTYDILEAWKLIERLKRGSEFVIGSRFRGNILPGAMPWPNRYIGNPILTGILNIFFNSNTSDAHSGFRAIT